PKLYISVIEDVIEGVQELFAEEGVEEQVLKDLKKLWQTKVMQSKATEGFFRHSHPSPQFTLRLPQPHSFHRVLQASAASLVIPAGRGFPHFTAAAEPGASRLGATLSFPLGITCPIRVPSGVTLQTAAGQLYKVNVPVMVAQASGDASVVHHSVHQIFQPLGHPSLLKANIASGAQVNVSPAQAATETSKPQESAVRQTTVFQPKTHVENSTSTTLVQQPSVSQQQLTSNAALNQCAGSKENSKHDSHHTAVFTSESSERFPPAESLVNDSSSVLLDLEGQLDIELQGLVQHPVSDDILDLIIMGQNLDDNTVLKDQESIASYDKLEPTEQMESNLRSEKDICSDTEGIIQLDGTGCVSPKEELPCTKDSEENEFIGFIESEGLKALEDDDEEDDEEECDSISNTESSSSGGDNEESHINIVEEDPLNSGDDVSEQDIPDLFDTDNVIVCQYDKILRNKNKWKFYLKGGMMCFEGKDHVFAKAIGDAEW
ncbi:TF2AY factor, partial [Turnix velox]|nr:TF2AY factor [Turnix velox]